VSGFSDGIVRQLFAGDEQWDTDQPSGALVQWDFHYPAAGAPGTPMYFRRGIFRASLRGQAASLRSAHIHVQQRDGEADEEPLQLQVDADQLTQSVDIDRTVLGGMLFHLYGQGRMLVQGLELMYSPKAPSRIPG
jgi:hypothetical protein